MTGVPVEALLVKARGAASIDDALTLTLEAISRAPSAPEPYALRALLAVAAKNPGAAAHYFRVAYGRGHRSLETRMGLSVCFEAVGDRAGAKAIARGHEVPRVLEPFARLAPTALFEIRRALEGPVPPTETPAWHADDVNRIGVTAPEPVRPSPKSSAPPQAPAGPRSSAPPGAAPVVRHDEESDAATPLGPLIEIEAAPRPDWLEVADGFGVGPRLGRPNWLEDTAQSGPRDVRQGGAVRALDFAMDPGLPGVAVVSPVTGRSVTVSALEEARRNASVGEFDPTRTLIEARALILPWIEATEGVHLALRLPGPVVTEQGKSPRKLCEELVLGLTESEILLVDADSLHAQPARIRLSSLTAMKSVAHGFQVSLALGEGKQVHLDLRSLQRDSSRVADTAIRLIADALRRQGGSD